MKKITLTLIGLTAALGVDAQTYQAPKIEFDSNRAQEVKVVTPSSESWRSNYKVQQTPGVERNVASDEHLWMDEAEKAAQKAPARDPSSVKPEGEHPHVKPWLWTGH